MVANSNRVAQGAHHQAAVYTGMYTMNPKPYIMSGLTAEPVGLTGYNLYTLPSHSGFSLKHCELYLLQSHSAVCFTYSGKIHTYLK